MSITRTATYRTTGAPIQQLREYTDPLELMYLHTYPGRSFVNLYSDDGLEITTISTFDSEEAMNSFDSDERIILIKQQSHEYMVDNGITVDIQTVNNSDTK